MYVGPWQEYALSKTKKTSNADAFKAKMERAILNSMDPASAAAALKAMDDVIRANGNVVPAEEEVTKPPVSKRQPPRIIANLQEESKTGYKLSLPNINSNNNHNNGDDYSVRMRNGSMSERFRDDNTPNSVRSSISEPAVSSNYRQSRPHQPQQPYNPNQKSHIEVRQKRSTNTRHVRGNQIIADARRQQDRMMQNVNFSSSSSVSASNSSTYKRGGYGDGNSNSYGGAALSSYNLNSLNERYKEGPPQQLPHMNSIHIDTHGGGGGEGPGSARSHVSSISGNTQYSQGQGQQQQQQQLLQMQMQMNQLQQQMQIQMQMQQQQQQQQGAGSRTEKLPGPQQPAYNSSAAVTALRLARSHERAIQPDYSSFWGWGKDKNGDNDSEAGKSNNTMSNENSKENRISQKVERVKRMQQLYSVKQQMAIDESASANNHGHSSGNGNLSPSQSQYMNQQHMMLQRQLDQDNAMPRLTNTGLTRKPVTPKVGNIDLNDHELMMIAKYFGGEELNLNSDTNTNTNVNININVTDNGNGNGSPKVSPSKKDSPTLAKTPSPSATMFANGQDTTSPDSFDGDDDMTPMIPMTPISVKMTNSRANSEQKRSKNGSGSAKKGMAGVGASGEWHMNDSETDNSQKSNDKCGSNRASRKHSRNTNINTNDEFHHDPDSYYDGTGLDSLLNWTSDLNLDDI